MQVRVLKTSGGKIQLTQKSDEEREAESANSNADASPSTKRARNTLEAAFARLGFKHSPEPEEEVSQFA